MGRPVGSKNKTQEVVPNGTPHKHLIENVDEKKTKNMQSLQSESTKAGTGILYSMSQFENADLAEITSSVRDSAHEDELQGLYTRLRKAGKDHKDALHEVRKRKESSTSPRLQKAAGSSVALQVLPHENTPSVEKIRQISTNKDHMGEGEPLCHGCGHRSDMHYIENRWTERRMAKNLQGDIGEIEIPMRKKNYDGARPCQHACLCKAFE